MDIHMRESRTKKIFLCCSILGFLLIFGMWRMSSNGGVRRHGGLDTMKNNSQFSYGVKTIHWYDPPPYMSQGLSDVVLSNCSNKCRFVVHNGDITGSDVVIFNGRYLQSAAALTATRPLGQPWVYYNLEPPPNSCRRDKHWKGIFNWTFTYRLDSDIVSPYTSTYSFSSSKRYSKHKSKLAFSVASNCHTESHREHYISRMQEIAPNMIDVYGGCGPNKCPPQKNCLDNFYGKYMFYLAFENSFQRDYVTEKFFQGMSHDGVITVARGAADYRKFEHAGTFINVQDFKSAEDLTHFLLSIASNTTLYDSFLKRHQKTIQAIQPPYCQLCDRLHDIPRYRRQYDDISAWFDAPPSGDWPDNLSVTEKLYSSLANSPEYMWFNHFCRYYPWKE